MGEVSKRNGKRGIPYALKADHGEWWQWSGPQLFRIDDIAHTYESIDVPANGRISFFFNDVDVWHFFCAKPFLLGMPMAEFKKQFAPTILTTDADEVRLKLAPRRKEIAIWCESAVLILDRRTWLAKAVKTQDVTGAESVHVFKNMTVNSWAKWWNDDLSNPSLEGYRQIKAETVSPTESRD